MSRRRIHHALAQWNPVQHGRRINLIKTPIKTERRDLADLALKINKCIADHGLCPEYHATTRPLIGRRGFSIVVIQRAPEKS